MTTCWATNGRRSSRSSAGLRVMATGRENGDYIYGRKRMREIDRELAHLARRMKAARVLDPADQPDRGRVWFGATVTLADEDDNRADRDPGR